MQQNRAGILDVDGSAGRVTATAPLDRSALLARLTSAGQEFELVERSVNGVPMRVYALGPHTLREVALESGAFGERTFILYGQERWTYAHHARLVAGLAQCLHEDYGLRKGDRVVVTMRNFPEWGPVFFATQMLGLVLVPLNAWWTAPELRYAIADAGAKLVVADEERIALLQPYRSELGGIPLIEVRGAGAPSRGVRSWNDLVDSTESCLTPPVVNVDPDDDSTILYTSGTTGRPKGAVATHRNHCTNLRNTQLGALVSASLASGGEPAPPGAHVPQSGVLCTFPLFHIGGITSLGNAAITGGKIALQFRWDPEGARELVRREQLTSVAGVPTVIRQLLEGVPDCREDFPSLTALSLGGGPVPPSLVRRIEGALNGSVAPVNGYGLTETTSAVVVNSGQDYFARPDSVGRCQPGTDVRVVDADTARDVMEGEVGELLFRGPNVARGYWKNPSATAAAFTDGWFRTGDLGRVVGGWVYVVDRMKDVVIRGGENIYCAEVEAALFDHPAIDDAAVVGVPHESLGEEAIAIVRARPGMTVTEADVRRQVATQLASFKVPARVFFRSEPLPRTSSGKVLKRELRSEIAEKIGEPLHG